LLFRIDDTDLKLDLAQIDAQLAAVTVKDDTLAASLGIARSDLELTRKELARQELLTSQGVATQTTLEAARRQELAARARLTEIDNQRRIGSAEREVLVAQRASVERSLGFAEIRAPYDLRVTEIAALAGQYVNRGQFLLAAEAVEVAAQFALGRVGPMLRLLGNGTTVMDLEAQVQLNSAGHQISWKATVERVGDAIDSRTQSASVVVRVDDSQAQATAGQRPPLRRNMFVEVLLLGKQLEVLAVPVEAVRDNVALLVSADGQLEKRKVSVGFVMGNLAVIDGGLSPGDQIVVTSPTIAVPGMAVSAVEDQDRKAALIADAAGIPAATGGGSGRAVGGGAGAGKNSNSGADGNESNSDTRVTGQ
jgi:multidrug efflux pump subunit AcrA (membrane-fusion protein)